MPHPSTLSENHTKLPWWTWVVPLPVFFIGTLLSLQAKITTGTSLLYFPLPLAIVLSYWWGPRVLVSFYLNATLCAGMWGLEKMSLWPLYAFPETLFAFLSWFLYVRLFEARISLDDARQVIYFLLIGIITPLLIYKLALEAIFVLTGISPIENYWNLLVTTGFGDFISAFCVATPLLYFFTGWMAKVNLLNHYNPTVFHTPTFKLPLYQWIELLGLALVGYLINRFLGFADYWFLNGLISLYIAIRFGFGATILFNTYFLLITYIIPVAAQDQYDPNYFLTNNMLKTQLGTALLYVFTVVTSRLVSDMRTAQQELNQRNEDLKTMNTELDRFVYSVSHDLSAPLKSILGLVQISRLTRNETEHRQQFDLIEKSVNKLEEFVSEVLDYTRNKRTSITEEEINLRQLCNEVLDNLKFMEGFGEIQFHLGSLDGQVVLSDKTRLKIIMQNIFSNAIKFRRKEGTAFVRLSVRNLENSSTLIIEDNGVGIKMELHGKIFDMFFKGTASSQGSGLGLYIAREVARKIGSEISLDSVFGTGTTVYIHFLKYIPREFIKT